MTGGREGDVEDLQLLDLDIVIELRVRKALDAVTLVVLLRPSPYASRLQDRRICIPCALFVYRQALVRVTDILPAVPVTGPHAPTGSRWATGLSR